MFTIKRARQQKSYNDSDGDDCEEQVMTNSSGTQENENKSIDPKYLCPLTQKVMLNPVIAFDDQCYDKQSPVTKEKIDIEWAIQILLEN